MKPVKEMLSFMGQLPLCVVTILAVLQCPDSKKVAPQPDAADNVLEQNNKSVQRLS